MQVIDDGTTGGTPAPSPWASPHWLADQSTAPSAGTLHCRVPHRLVAFEAAIVERPPSKAGGPDQTDASRPLISSSLAVSQQLWWFGERGARGHFLGRQLDTERSLLRPWDRSAID